MKADEIVEPCPFCGVALSIQGGVNPYGRCDTEGCWMNARKTAVPLDDPQQVAAWNTRASLTPPSPPDVDIRGIALGAIKEMRETGESHEMCARWISERVNAAQSLTPSPPELVEVLEPFAERADLYNGKMDSVIVMRGFTEARAITVGDLRNARAALTKARS